MSLFRKTNPQEPNIDTARLTRNLDEAEIRHLEVLRREVGNLIVVNDPDLMVRCYERAWVWERETSAAPDRLRADEIALVTKIKHFQDFDIINQRHFVPYDEVFCMTSIEDIVDRYLDLSRMLIFMKNRSSLDVIRLNSLHDKAEYDILKGSMERIKRLRLRGRIDDALQRCHCYQAGYEAASSDLLKSIDQPYSDQEVDVFRLPWRQVTPDNEVGIIFKKTDEYAIYSTFYDSDRERAYKSYYRSDASFSNRVSL